MATEVLLMQDVTDLGCAGDVVNVADGYARNYLLPQKLAAPVTEATRRRLAKLQAERAAQDASTLAAAQTLAQKLAAASCTITVKTGEEDRMYGSVTAQDIVQALEAQGITLDRHAVTLEHPIKELGVFDIPVRLHSNVSATLKVWVVQE